MVRQGKFTKRVTPAQHAKRQARRRFRWLRSLSWKKRFLYFGTPVLAFLIVTPMITYLYFARDISDQERLMNRNNTGVVPIAIEQTYSKDQILDMYLNSAFFGGNSFGIEDAAVTYFGKKPADLTLGESAMLIGILPAPNAYSPLYGNMEYAKERQNTVLKRMLDNGVITEQEKDAALAEALPLQPVTALADSSKAPHYTEMVMKELYDKYGEEKVTRSGYQVTTTLDMNVQNQLQAAIDANMRTINRNGGSNASAVAIDPSTGEVRGLIGSYNWNDENFGKVNMVTTARQPGSSFKPIYYSQALADGTITPATILHDKKTDFGGVLRLIQIKNTGLLLRSVLQKCRSSI
ncbi:transglycosylase domain-containing protein [Candidatus Saccharibacteria bacterium]|nr:transglycosylase domain-containing protein [Candidatus Saccharibacteria bacterium]